MFLLLFRLLQDGASTTAFSAALSFNQIKKTLCGKWNMSSFIASKESLGTCLCVLLVPLESLCRLLVVRSLDMMIKMLVVKSLDMMIKMPLSVCVCVCVCVYVCVCVCVCVVYVVFNLFSYNFENE